MSAAGESFEARRAALVARAAADRENVARQIAPLGNVKGSFQGLHLAKADMPWVTVAGLALSALTLVVPSGRFPLVRGTLAAFRLAGSVRRLLSRN